MCMQNRFYCMKQLNHWRELSLSHSNAQYQMADTWMTDNYLAQKTIMNQTNSIINCHQTFRTTLTHINAIQIQKINKIFNLIKIFRKHQI